MKVGRLITTAEGREDGKENEKSALTNRSNAFSNAAAAVLLAAN